MSNKSNIIKFRKGARTEQNPKLLNCFKCKIKLKDGEDIFSKSSGKRKYYHIPCAKIVNLI